MISRSGGGGTWPTSAIPALRTPSFSIAVAIREHARMPSRGARAAAPTGADAAKESPAEPPSNTTMPAPPVNCSSVTRILAVWRHSVQLGS